MKYRLMRRSDYDKVYSLWMSCKGMGLNDVDDSEAGITRFLMRNPYTCFVAEEDGEILGVIMSGHDGRRGFIYHTAVHPDFRRKGYGKALVELALQALKEEGISKVALLVFRHNDAANAFWEKLGFIERNDINYRNISLVTLTRYDT